MNEQKNESDIDSMWSDVYHHLLTITEGEKREAERQEKIDSLMYWMLNVGFIGFLANAMTYKSIIVSIVSASLMLIAIAYCEFVCP